MPLLGSEGTARLKRTLLNALIIVAGFTVASVLLLVGVLAFLLEDLCGHEVLQRVPGPDSEREAVLYRTNCGATTEYVYSVAVQPPGLPIESRDNDAFRSSWPDSIRLRWSAERELSIVHGGAERIWFEASSVGDVRVAVKPTHEAGDRRD